MNGFDNSNLKTGLKSGPVGVGFTPKLDFVYDSEAKTIVVTDTSTFISGDDRKIAQLQVIDKNGKKVVSSLPGNDADDAISIDVSTLDASGGFTILGTQITNNGLKADGSARLVGVSITDGSLGSWNIQEQAL